MRKNWKRFVWIAVQERSCGAKMPPQTSLYFVKNGGIVTCREPATGKTVFEQRLGAAGGYYASPVATDGRIYVVSDPGAVTVFEAGDSLKVLARNDLQESVMATPAIVDGKLYIRTAKRLYAFGD